MKIFKAAEYGIVPGAECAEKLSILSGELALTDEEKTLVFEKGEYFIDTDKLPQEKFFITNTVGDGEWKKVETPHLNRAGISLKGVKNLVVEGGGARFVLRGQACNAALRDCKRVTLKDVAFDSEAPDMHELKVVRRGAFYIDYAVDKYSTLKKICGKWFFVGKGYSALVTFGRPAGWIGKVTAKDENCIKRVNHPLTGAFAMSMPQKGIFRAHYVFTPLYKKKDTFCLFDVRRKYNGIFAENCEELVFEGVEQNFNYGLALVCQMCDGVTMRGCRFAPRKGVRYMASVADFVQICMCRGTVVIENNYFEGSGDDGLNVHGIHFPVTKTDGKRITVKFAHPQSHGFNPFKAGDRLRIIDKNTLLEKGACTLVSSRLADEHTLELILDKEWDFGKGAVIENASACPEVVYEGNTLERIITRGALFTSAGASRIENNKFLHTSMHAIHISDDAENWFESGMVKNLRVSGNYFGKVNGAALSVKPENKKCGGVVHSGIVFENNTISADCGGCYVKDAQVKIKNNIVEGKPRKSRFVRGAKEV